MSDEHIQAAIRQIVADSVRLADEWNPDGDDDLVARIAALDNEIRAHLPPGEHLAVGRYLTFTYGDGSEISYIIDDIAGDRVHCLWVANADAYESEALDCGGWTLRSVAERRIARRAWRE